jgi:hypothetical protein
MRSILSIGLALAFCISAPVLLTSCGDDDDIDIRRPDVHAIYAVGVHHLDLSLSTQVDFVLPASFDVTGKSLEAAMAPEAVQTIDRLKPEYAEALVTDALNFTGVRRRT